MTKWRSDLVQGDPLPQDFFDALQEFIGTYVSANFTVSIFNPTTLRVPAGADNAQVGIGINGKWRYNAVNADAAAPGGLTVGDNPLFVTASANVFAANPSPPPTELDSTDYSFHLLVLPSGQTPTGSGTQAQWRQIGTVTWDGSQFTAVKLNVADAAGATRTSDITARTGLATQTLIGSVGGAAGISLGSAGDVTIKRDTTGGNKATVNVPVNATAFQVAGTPLAASHLSNGVTGSGAVALAVSPALTGTPTVPTAAVDTNTTQAASTAFVLAQAASAAPAMDGTAAVGTSTRYARADHVHPIDTSRAPLASPTFTGTPAGPTPTAGTNTTQLATTAFVMAAIGGLPGSPVTSVFGRSGAVGAQTGDYVVAQITGAAADNVVVHLAGGETVTGAKQFNVGPRWATQSLAAAGTIGDGTASVVLTDTTTAAFTATLPLTPSAGSWFRFIDSTAKWGTNNLTIGRNGKTIDGAAANLVLARDNATVTLYFDGTGWRTVGIGLVSPALTGVPTVPTAAVDTATTQAASTAFVLAQAASATPLMDGTAAVGTSTRYARGDHVHPIDTSRAPLASPTFTGTPAGPTAAVDTSTTQLATTGFVLSQAAAANPLMNGAVAVGTSTRFARADHVHPVDTSRAPLASPTLTGTPAGPTAAVDTSTTQLATTAFVIGQAASATPLMNAAAAVGTSTRYARADHVHPIDTSRAPLASPTFTGVVQATSGGYFASTTAGVGSWALEATVVGESQPRFVLENDGTIFWGPGGTGALDARLYRLSGLNLRTDSSFWVDNSVIVANSGSGSLYVGSQLDTYMNRNAAGQLSLNAKLIEGLPAYPSLAVPATFTPDTSTGLDQRVVVNAGGAATLFIGAPLHPPSGSQSTLMIVQIANTNGATIGLSWNGAFLSSNTLALPANLATGRTAMVLFCWDGANWRIVSIG